MGGLGDPEILILLFVLLPPVVIIIGIVDAARRPAWAFERAGQSKTLWVVLQVVGIFLYLVGVILTIVYLTSIRPKVVAAEGGQGAWQAGPQQGGPPPGWWLASDGRWYPPQGPPSEPPGSRSAL